MALSSRSYKGGIWELDILFSCSSRIRSHRGRMGTSKNSNTSTMQLVEKNAHETNRHKGSVADFKREHGEGYDNKNAKDKAEELNNQSPCPLPTS